MLKGKGCDLLPALSQKAKAFSRSCFISQKIANEVQGSGFEDAAFIK
jgi:hypothetical protein